MQDIEKLYKDKLENHHSPVSERVWQNVAIALGEQKRKRRVYLIYLAALALVLALILGYFILNKGGTAKKDINNSPAAKKHSETAYNKQNIKQNIGSIISPTVNSASISVKEIKTNGVAEQDISHISSKHGLSQAPKAKNIFSQTREINTNLLSSNQFAYLGVVKELSSTTSNTAEDKNITFKKLYSIFHDKNPIKFSRPNNGFIFGKKRRGILNDCFPIKRNFYFLEAYFSNDYNQRTLTGDNYEFLTNRNKTESNLYSYSIGVMGGFLMSNGFNIKTGINYTNINEKFNITFKNVVSTQTIITIDTIKNPDGSITEIRDTTVKEIFGERNVQETNTYSMFDIPLIIGLNYRKFNHKIGLSAGVIFNIIARQKGTILSHLDDIGDKDGLLYINSGNNVFRKNVGVSVYASFAYSYRLLSRYELFVEPNIRYYLKSFTKGDYPLNQNYTKYGISIGTRYIF